MLNHILGGGGFESRLFSEVREKRGLAYSVYSHLAPYEHAGLFMGGVSTRNDRAAESLDIIVAEIKRIANDGPTADELDKAKRYPDWLLSLAVRYFRQNRGKSPRYSVRKPRNSTTSTSATR